MVSISSEKPAELVYPESRHGGDTRACHTRNRADCKRCIAKIVPFGCRNILLSIGLRTSQCEASFAQHPVYKRAALSIILLCIASNASCADVVQSIQRTLEAPLPCCPDILDTVPELRDLTAHLSRFASTWVCTVAERTSYGCRSAHITQICESTK